MADLIVIAFDSEQHAEEAYQTIQKLQGDLVVELAGLALVKVDNEGKTHVSTPNSGAIIGLGAASGALQCMCQQDWCTRLHATRGPWRRQGPCSGAATVGTKPVC